MKNRKKYFTTREIQKEELEILKVLISFFKKNNLTYYAWGGTFLGAVRHRGFIPWDDDIDLAMIRPDYDKLIKILKSNNNKIIGDLEGISYELGNSDFPFLKIVNKKIKVDEKEKCDNYLWVDIFPLDSTPKNNTLYYRRFLFLKKIFYLKRNIKNNVEIPYSNKFKKILKIPFLLILKAWNYEKFLNHFYKVGTKYKYDEYNYIRDNVWSSSKTVFSKDILKSKKYKFEGLSINGLADYDFYLTKIYGDYMKLPPEDERVTHNIKVWRDDK